jgi:hypothetical protein
VIAAERWDEIAAHYYQVNLFQVPAWKFLGMVFVWALERVEHDKIESWLEELKDLLPWQTTQSEAAAEIESASFMALMAKQK